MSEINKIEGFEQAQEHGPTTQVYKATHKGDGLRLPFMSRSFISFSYGGKLIEDFGFIVSIDGDRMERGLYANFQDNVSETEILDQRFFWSTHLSGTDLELTLSTDEVTENQIEEFKRWFCPGKNKELILSEHPNRAIMARVGSVPQIHLLPFEKKTSAAIGGLVYQTSTTIYRGNIDITFTFDDPLWYSVSNVLYYKEDSDSINYDKWLSAQGISTFIYQDPDAAKVVLEDGIPINAMLKYANMLTGSDVIISASTLPETQIDHAEIESGRIGPLFESTDGLDVPVNTKNALYFYYGGTAPSKPILQFTLTPTIDEEGYINSPINSFIDNDSPYNTIVFESKTKKEFRFTTPSIWTGYNQAIAILKKMDGQPLIDVRRALREGVNHWAPRAYAIVVACTSKQVESSVQSQESGAGETGTAETGSEETGAKTEKLDASKSVNKMKDFLKVKEQSAAPSSTSTSNSNENESPDQENNEQQNNNQNTTISSEYYSANFIIDNKSGKVTGEFKFRDTEDEEKNEKEDAGDMIRSNYLIIEDRNYPSSSGYIEYWTEENPEYSHRVYHDVEGGLTNVLIKYKNMYY